MYKSTHAHFQVPFQLGILHPATEFPVGPLDLQGCAETANGLGMEASAWTWNRVESNHGHGEYGVYIYSQYKHRVNINININNMLI